MSISEIRANKEEKASLWTPRDALIAALRDVDSKKVNPFVAFIVLGNQDTEREGTYTRFWTAGKNNYEITGLVIRGLFMFENDD